MLTGFIVWIQRTEFFPKFTLILCTENVSYTELDCCTILGFIGFYRVTQVSEEKRKKNK